MKIRRLGSWLVLGAAIGFFGLRISMRAEAPAAVRLWEAPLTIPTYEVGPPDRDPIFYNGRAYQGAQSRVYPYPMLDKLTDVRVNKTYDAVYLENQFVKICVLPQIGGRILSAEDKTDGYDFFYHQHVIKPALIGMLGAWISGGVEWDLPHHHRATTFMTVDHTLQVNPDGSRTVWVGEIERRHRMRWIVGLTLHPGKSYLEATVKLFNRTPVQHSFLYFANAAVHADADYQVIFPPSATIATFHAKNRFLYWPMSDRDFSGVRFGHPVDMSWWKNHPSPTSWFCFECKEDFLAGYDHGKHAGVVHVADHHVVPGKKFWEWGNGAVGRMWDKILTDADGPYIELMAGGYSDNQPDYSWIQPYEVKTLKQYWYPIRQLGGAKNANLDAALNLEVGADHQARIAFNTTSEFRDARAVLTAQGKDLFEQKIDIGPDKPFVHEVPLPAGVKETDLTLALYAATGRELISYTPVAPPRSPLPEPVKPPPAPKDIKTVEQLYLTGLRIEQFYNPSLEPYPYYEEALRRDPGNDRVNTELGILYCQRGKFKEAEEHLRTALARVTHDYTSPKDGTPFYYLGVALAGQGKYAAAYDAFFKATWSWAWHAAGYYQLARLACRQGNYAHALGLLEHSIQANTLNTPALDLKAALLRKLARPGDAEAVAAQSLALDPLDFWAGNELYLARAALREKDPAGAEQQALRKIMRDDPQNYLSLAVDYGDCALWGEALDVLTRAARPGDAQAKVDPMVYYYLGYYSEMEGEKAKAAQYFRRASEMPPDYCFPFRWESVDVLQHALKSDPRDAHAYYYLGNLYYDSQPENAIRAWEFSQKLDDRFALVHRNLALAYAQAENNPQKALASMHKAVALDGSDPQFLFELDELAEQAGVAPEKRLAELQSHQQTVLQRDDAVQREIVLEIELGKYDPALDLLSHRHFHVWEGGGEIHDVYINAHLLRGQQYFREKRYREALQDFQAALEYPENLEVGRPYFAPREAEINYLVGTAYEALGNAASARAAYQKSVAEKVWPSEVAYFQGLAFAKLGEEGKAQEIFQSLVRAGQAELAHQAGLGYFAKFGRHQSAATRQAGAHYLIGLGYLGEGKRAEAKAEFQQSLERDQNLLGARTQLAALEERSGSGAE
jgi:tetratricopeptide (TPR) repeat protein